MELTNYVEQAGTAEPMDLDHPAEVDFKIFKNFMDLKYLFEIFISYLQTLSIEPYSFSNLSILASAAVREVCKVAT